MKSRKHQAAPGQVKLSREFHEAFGVCARHHGWVGDELEEMRAVCRTDVKWRCYLVLLADAIRNEWYAQNPANDFIRLDAFFAAIGRDMVAELAALEQKEVRRLAAKAAQPKEGNAHHGKTQQSGPNRQPAQGRQRFAGRRQL